MYFTQGNLKGESVVAARQCFEAVQWLGHHITEEIFRPEDESSKTVSITT